MLIDLYFSKPVIINGIFVEIGALDGKFIELGRDRFEIFLIDFNSKNKNKDDYVINLLNKYGYKVCDNSLLEKKMNVSIMHIIMKR